TCARDVVGVRIATSLNLAAIDNFALSVEYCKQFIQFVVRHEPLAEFLAAKSTTTSCFRKQPLVSRTAGSCGHPPERRRVSEITVAIRASAVHKQCLEICALGSSRLPE